MRVSVRTYVFISLGRRLRVKLACIRERCIKPFTELPDRCPKWLCHFTFPPALCRVPSSPRPHQYFSLPVFCLIATPDGYKTRLHCHFDLYFPYDGPAVSSDALCTHWLSVYFWRNVYADLLPIFLFWLFVFLLLNSKSSLCFLTVSLLPGIWFANILSPSNGLSAHRE